MLCELSVDFFVDFCVPWSACKVPVISCAESVSDDVSARPAIISLFFMFKVVL